MLHPVLTLARASNLPTVWSNVTAAWLLSGCEPTWRLIPVLAGASLLYAGGCTLNDAFDAKWDAAHRPERIIPAGILTRRTVWAIGLTEMTAGTALVLAAGTAHWRLAPALAACILLYDAWHKQSPWSVVTMGACRWLLILTAAASATADLHRAMAGGAVLWLYIIVLSLVARGEAKRQNHSPGARRLLLIIPAALAAMALLPGFEPAAAWLPPLIFTAGMAALLPRTGAPVPILVNRLLAAIPLVDLCVCLAARQPDAGTLTPWLAVFPAAIALSILFQRWFHAT